MKNKKITEYSESSRSLLAVLDDIGRVVVKNCTVIISDKEYHKYILVVKEILQVSSVFKENTKIYLIGAQTFPKKDIHVCISLDDIYQLYVMRYYPETERDSVNNDEKRKSYILKDSAGDKVIKDDPVLIYTSEGNILLENIIKLTNYYSDLSDFTTTKEYIIGDELQRTSFGYKKVTKRIALDDIKHIFLIYPDERKHDFYKTGCLF